MDEKELIEAINRLKEVSSSVETNSELYESILGDATVLQMLCATAISTFPGGASYIYALHVANVILLAYSIGYSTALDQDFEIDEDIWGNVEDYE